MTDLTPPVVPESPETIRRQYLSHETSVRGIGLLYYLSAGLFALGALFSPSARQENVIIAMVCLAVAAIFFYIGRQFRILNPRIRIAGVVLAIVGLTGFPLGTLINVFVLYLLLSKKGKFVFSDEYRAVIAETPQIKYKMSIVVVVLLYFTLGVVLLGVLAAIFMKH